MGGGRATTMGDVDLTVNPVHIMRMESREQKERKARAATQVSGGLKRLFAAEDASDDVSPEKQLNKVDRYLQRVKGVQRQPNADLEASRAAAKKLEKRQLVRRSTEAEQL